MPRLGSLLLMALLPLLLAPTLARAQTPQERRPVQGWELPGLDITPNGGWRVRARAVAARRAQLLAQRDFRALNAAPVGPAGATTVSGTLRVPAIMFRYQDSPVSQFARDTSQYNATLFASAPPGGKPYTLRTFYEQLSNGVFSIQGRAVGWVALTGNESAYTGNPGGCAGSNPFGTTNCNGLFGSSFALMQAGLAAAVHAADSLVDFGQFDNNGPDNIPNSGDDDGVVDAVLFLHPSMDGACLSSTNNHLWSHRSNIFVSTNDNAHNGGKIIVSDYILQSGLGSPSGGVCDSTAIMPIGTAAHELGHILALPDLYPQQATQGIGEWGLMGSGNYTKPQSPTRYEAWSLQQMGWATIVPLTTTGTYRVGPEPTADTVFFVDVHAPNPRPEHFLIENRQAVQSDSAMIRLHGGGGLMLWHIDDEIACLITVCGGNSVNEGPIHGVALEEADGLRQLWCEVNGCNRGDGGDPYPGTSGNTSFSFATTPAATKNSDTSFAGFAIDSIRQLVPNGAMAFRLRFGAVTTVQANDTTAIVLVDGAPYNVFRDLFGDGSSHTIAVDTPQFSPSGRTRFTFGAWSDGGAISHTITGALAGASYTVTLNRSHRLNVTVGANGTVGYNPAADTNGTFIPEGTPVTLTATPTAPAVFGGWTGDTISSNLVLTLPMGRPYAVSAHFDAQIAITSGDPRPGGIMGKPYADTLRASGGTGNFSWQVVAGALPAGLALAVNGRITGIPTQIGIFTFTARVTSGAQQTQQAYGLSVTAPTLVAANVVAQLLNAAGTLTIDDIRYLDLIGNQNCGTAVTAACFDVGDFLAWVQATGATPAPPTAAVAAQKGGRP